MEQLGLNESLLEWDTLGEFKTIPENTKVIEKGVPIFPRLDNEVEIQYIKEQMAVTAPKESKWKNQNKKSKWMNHLKLQLMHSKQSI